MPSLWLYLKTLDPHVPEYFFGLIMGGFNLASMLASPFFGYWMDRRPMKEIIVFCMFVGVIGNATYALAPNIYVVMLGRLISGVGVRVQCFCSFLDESFRLLTFGVFLGAGQRLQLWYDVCDSRK